MAFGESPQSAPEDRELGTFNVHLYEIDGLIGVKQVVELARRDLNSRDLFVPVRIWESPVSRRIS